MTSSCLNLCFGIFGYFGILDFKQVIINIITIKKNYNLRKFTKIKIFALHV